MARSDGNLPAGGTTGLKRLQPRLSWPIIALFLFAAAESLGAAPADAQTPMQEIHLELSTGQLIDLPQPAKNVFIADPAIADLQVPSPRNVFIFGKKTGT